MIERIKIIWKIDENSVACNLTKIENSSFVNFDTAVVVERFGLKPERNGDCILTH